jgi:hypothetical protein
VEGRKVAIFRFAFVDVCQGGIGGAQVDADFHASSSLREGEGAWLNFSPVVSVYWAVWPTSKRHGIFLSIWCAIPLLTAVLWALGSMLAGFIRAHGSF